MDPTDTAAERFERAKQDSTIERLFRVARRLDALARSRIRERTGMPVRQVHTQLLPHLDREGIRLTDLAARLGVTKQAIAPAVDELETWGVVEKIPDPSDGRARLVRFAGVDALMDGLGTLHALEEELAAVVGADALAEVRRVMQAIDQWLDGAAHPRGPS